MKPRRMIASLMMCLLLAGTTVASADSDRDRGDRKRDRGSKSEERSKPEKSRRERTVQRGDSREWRTSDRRTAQTYREPHGVEHERSRPRHVRTNEHVVSRTRTQAGWHDRALRGRAQHAAWDQHRARRWHSEHRTWRARGGYHGYRIPEYRYRTVCGPSHRFRVDRYPLVIMSG